MKNFLKDFIRPVNIVFLLFSIISLFIAVKSYIQSNIPKTISYVITTEKLINYKDFDDHIRLYADGNQLIDSNLYTSTISIWNSGTASITNKDLYRKMNISLLDSGKVISAMLSNEIEPDVSNFRLVTTDNKNVLLEFDNFDIDLGTNIKVVYTSHQRTKMSVERAFRYYFQSKEIEPFRISGFVSEGRIINQRTPIRRIVFNLFRVIYIGMILCWVAILMKKLVKRIEFLKGLSIIFELTAKSLLFISFISFGLLALMGILYKFLGGIPSILDIPFKGL